MSAANDNKLAYSPAEAAQALGIGRSTIFDLMRNGQLRRVKIGAKTVIPRSSLEALLAESPDAA
ncbi:Helix-turn-helix domain protein [compost metagenome]